MKGLKVGSDRFSSDAPAQAVASLDNQWENIMAMSKKDFIAIADALKHHIDSMDASKELGMPLPDSVIGTHNTYCKIVASALDRTSPNFNRPLFLKAAGCTNWIEW